MNHHWWWVEICPPPWFLISCQQKWRWILIMFEIVESIFCPPLEGRWPLMLCWIVSRPQEVSKLFGHFFPTRARLRRASRSEKGQFYLYLYLYLYLYESYISWGIEIILIRKAERACLKTFPVKEVCFKSQQQMSKKKNERCPCLWKMRVGKTNENVGRNEIVLGSEKGVFFGDTSSPPSPPSSSSPSPTITTIIMVVIVIIITITIIIVIIIIAITTRWDSSGKRERGCLSVNQSCPGRMKGQLCFLLDCFTQKST